MYKLDSAPKFSVPCQIEVDGFENAKFKKTSALSSTINVPPEAMVKEAFT